MKTALRSSLVVVVTLILVSCGNYNNGASALTHSGLKFRVFVSNPLQATGTGGGAPVINVVDALKDSLSRYFINLSGVNPVPGLMALSPDKRFTLVYSATGNAVSVIDNVTEAIAANLAGGNIPTITLSDFTESMFVGTDNVAAYAAVPNAAINGQSPGAVQAMNITTGTITATIPVPGAHYIAQSHNGERILAMGETSDSVTVIVPSNIGTSIDPRTFVPGFDHPVGAVFSDDDTTAYIFNCGPECGGVSASVTVLDMNTNLPGVTIPLVSGAVTGGATTGLLSSSTLYVAGTPFGAACGSATPPCGILSIIDLGSMAVTGTAPIAAGFHTRMALSPDGQLFIGGRGCIAGCLSIFNTGKQTVTLPAATGDVTGFQPITNRSVMYVCEGGEMQIYDTTTDVPQTKQVDIIGQATDVKLVD